MKEAKTRVTVDVGIGSLWKCLSKDLLSILPQVIPNLVQNGEVIEGDGGLGTVILFSFGPDVPNMKYQKEKIVELDESVHRIGLQVVEGGHLDLGFTFYKTSFQLTAISEKQTLVDVVYERETEQRVLPAKTTAGAIACIKGLENYLLSTDATT
ncbi:phytohormone-binding protein-like [Rhodamnia argentea]|uniref:Phytohormone-binding protein-like n=1 Tax=Rhodamnia argentea TaxID=178133 RepID=A0A8B8QS27_9MYRT|nr:phytohormone-binding protein-like [Rhodamnia argentea]